MPFDYVHGSPYVPHQAEAWREQHVRAIRERARLLHNLRFSLEDAVNRIQVAYSWEFDEDFASTPLPDFYEQIPSLVKDVFDNESGTKQRRLTW